MEEVIYCSVVWCSVCVCMYSKYVYSHTVLYLHYVSSFTTHCTCKIIPRTPKHSDNVTAGGQLIMNTVSTLTDSDRIGNGSSGKQHRQVAGVEVFSSDSEPGGTLSDVQYYHIVQYISVEIRTMTAQLPTVTWQSWHSKVTLQKSYIII